MTSDFDLVILGSGFGGSLMSMVARRLGLSVLLLERSSHPRFAIGESTSPLANLVLEGLAHTYDLPRLLPLTKWGVWQQNYPHLAVGLKRGFAYFHHRAGRPFTDAADRDDQLLVAASPRDEISDTHWYRADLDHFLVNEAVALGVEYWDRTEVDSVQFDESRSVIGGNRNRVRFDVRARLVIDATGPRGALSRLLALPESGFKNYPETRMLFSHFSSVSRCDEMPAFSACRSTADNMAPFNADDAALHHVFDGGWMWVLRFNNGVTSAGVALTDRLATELNLAEGALAWKRIVERFPSVAAQFADAKSEQPFIYAARPTYRCSVVVGPGWALLPSAAGFVDPLYSTGIPLTLLGVERIAQALQQYGTGPDLDAALDQHGRQTLAELDWTAQYIAANYAAMPSFPHFTAFSMYYFAAASYSEMTRRLEKPSLNPGFLGRERGEVAARMRDAGLRLRRMERPGVVFDLDAREFTETVHKGIEEINIAGLADSAKRNWYGVDLNEMIATADRLDFKPCELASILVNATWT